MVLSVNTFETNPTEENISFAFHEKIEEGREIYFLAKFHPKTQDPQSYAENVFGSIIDTFKENEERKPYDTFEESLKSANVEMEKRKPQVKEKPEIVVLFFDFHNVHLSESGNSEVYLIREGTLSQITENNENEIGFSNILSGQIAVNDVIIVSTDRLLRLLTSNQIVDLFEHKDFSQNISLLKQELRTKTKEDLLVSVIGVGKEEVKASTNFLSKMVSKKTKPTHVEKIPPQENVVPEQKQEAAQENNVQNPEEASQEELEKDVDSVQESIDIRPNEIEEKKSSFSTKTTDRLKNMDFSSVLRNIKNALTQKNPQKKLIITTISLILLFGIVISIRVAQNYESEAEQEVKNEIQLARNAVKQANELLLQGDRKGANELLNSAEDLVQGPLNSSFKELRSQAVYIKADIEKQKLEAENAKEISPQRVADLGVKNDNIQALEFNEIRGNLYVNDATKIFKTIRSIVENPVPVTNDEVIVASAARSAQDTLILLTNTPRIIEYKGGLVSPMNTKDPSWKKGIDIEVYGSRFIYILDPISNQIWKYERRRADYSEAIPYNKSADLSQAVSMAIDGSIYILSDDGSIQRLMRGENEPYEFRDLPSKPFQGKNIRLFTTAEHDFLYVLDPDNARVLVFQKGDRFATYRKQVYFNLSDAVDFHINESGQKVNILTSDKIYEFDL